LGEGAIQGVIERLDEKKNDATKKNDLNID